MPIATAPRPLTLLQRTVASLITGLAIAIVVHFATVLVHFVANGSAAENLAPISAYFFPASAVLFVLASVAAALEANRYWSTAFGAGIVSGALAALASAVVAVLAAGAAVTADLFGPILATLAGNNLAFVVAAAIVFPTLGRRVWHLASKAARGADTPLGRLAIVRAPSARLAEGELTHLERTPVDLAKADEQWDAYVAALEEAGFTTVDVQPDDALPDSVFVEDTLVVFGDLAVITSPGAESRRGETDAVRATADDLGLEVHAIELPGTLDGGDVLAVGTTVYVGRSGRTNAEGIRQLRALIAPLGYTVVAVPVKKALHLKSTVSALPDGTVVGFAKLVDNPQVFERFLAVPEASGAAVVVLAPDAVLMAASAPKSAALIADLGYRVVTVDIGEFEKLEAGVTCLSVRIEPAGSE